MRSTRYVTSLPLVLFSSVAGCASGVEAGDEAANEVPNDAVAEPEVATTSAYFSIMSDLRRCASPGCGGWFLQRLNQPTTRCNDGTTAARCYTPVLDWSQSGLPAAQRTELLDECTQYAGSPGVYAIVRGTFMRVNHTTPRPELGRFVITEAWLSENDALSGGAFVNVKDNGIRCLVAPCPSLTETSLNLGTATNIADVDFAPAALDDAQIQECRELMATPTGLIVAGDRYTVTVDGRNADGRTATAAFYRLTP